MSSAAVVTGAFRAMLIKQSEVFCCNPNFPPDKALQLNLGKYLRSKITFFVQSRLDINILVTVTYFLYIPHWLESM